MTDHRQDIRQPESRGASQSTARSGLTWAQGLAIAVMGLVWISLVPLGYTILGGLALGLLVGFGLLLRRLSRRRPSDGSS